MSMVPCRTGELCVLVQVTMKLFEGKLDNHTGTYMGGIGFQFERHTIVVSLQTNGDIAGVTVNYSGHTLGE